jgi:hypothetical protein
VDQANNVGDVAALTWRIALRVSPFSWTLCSLCTFRAPRPPRRRAIHGWQRLQAKRTGRAKALSDASCSHRSFLHHLDRPCGRRYRFLFAEHRARHPFG